VVDSSCESDDDVAPESGAPATEPDIDDSSTLDRIVGSRPDADFIKQTLRAQVYHDTLLEYGHCVHSHSLLMSRLGRRRGAAGGNRREGAAGEQALSRPSATYLSRTRSTPSHLQAHCHLQGHIADTLRYELTPGISPPPWPLALIHPLDGSDPPILPFRYARGYNSILLCGIACANKNRATMGGGEICTFRAPGLP
jgi:hypothetical protein